MSAEKLPKKKQVFISEIIRRKPFPKPGEEIRKATRYTTLSLMSSEEANPLPPRQLHRSSPPSPPVRTVSSDDSDDEGDGLYRGFNKYLHNKHEQMMAFLRVQYKRVASYLFWIFLPITLPCIILRAIVSDCFRARQIVVLTLECMIMQLELIFETMQSIRSSNATAETKMEKMGRAFHIFNMFNPIHWLGMFFYYVDHNVKTMSAREAAIQSEIIDYSQTPPISPDQHKKPKSILATKSSGHKSGTLTVSFKDQVDPDTSQPKTDETVKASDPEEKLTNVEEEKEDIEDKEDDAVETEDKEKDNSKTAEDMESENNEKQSQSQPKKTDRIPTKSGNKHSKALFPSIPEDSII